MEKILKYIYEEFTNKDQDNELSKYNHHKNKNFDLISSMWSKWYKINYFQFERWIWKLSKSSEHSIQNFIDTTGTLNVTLTLLEILLQNKLIQISEDNIIKIKEPLLSWRVEIKKNFLINVGHNNQKEYGQFRVEWQSSLSRASIINEEVPNIRRIFFCGDDDYTSLALSQISEIPITVGDIDNDVLKLINDISEKYECNIKAVKYDIYKSTDMEFSGKFDAVHCDPLDSGKGLSHWLERIDELLTGDIGNIAFINISIERLGARISFFQEHMASKGFYLDRIVRNINYYKVSEEPYVNRTNLENHFKKMGLSSECLNDLYIQTSMLIFIRSTSKKYLYPQEFFEIRRKI